MQSANEAHLLLWSDRMDRPSMKMILSSLSDASQSKCEFFYPPFQPTTIYLLFVEYQTFFALFSFSSFTSVTHIVHQIEAQSAKTSDPSTSI